MARLLGNVSSAGVVAPGASIGTLTVNGNYNQTNTGALAIELSPTVSSVLAVRGTATLAGTLALLPDAGTYTPYTKYSVLTATNGVTGTFGNVVNLFPTVGLSVSYQPNSVTVTTLPAYSFREPGRQRLGESRNNQHVAAALDQAYPTASRRFQECDQQRLLQHTAAAGSRRWRSSERRDAEQLRRP